MVILEKISFIFNKSNKFYPQINHVITEQPLIISNVYNVSKIPEIF